jgi:flagellar biogenesis protein FliO
MTDVSFVDLVVRMVVSLGIVLGLMYGAYWFMRRRQGFGPTEPPRLVRSFARLANKPGAVRTSGARVPGNRRGLRVLGRVGVGRTSQVVAVQFADKVLLMAAGDTSAPTVIAEMDLEAWRAVTEAADDDSPMPVAPIVREAIDPSRPRPTGFVDALREATTRRG